jgi:predicted Zn-dependent protease with MMP-like domain
MPDTIHPVLDIPREEFEELVSDALDAIPPELAALISNCVVLVADDVPPGSRPLLGLYEGTPLTQRDGWYSGVLPDRITIYRRPILAICHTREDVVDEVLVTVVHEVAHHFGISDERLHDLGWG